MKPVSKHIPKYKVGDILNMFHPNINPLEDITCENYYIEVVTKTGYIVVGLEDHDPDWKDFYPFSEIDFDGNACKIGEMTADWSQVIAQRTPKQIELLNHTTVDLEKLQVEVPEDTSTPSETLTDLPEKRKRGRPKGSKNKSKADTIKNQV